MSDTFRQVDRKTLYLMPPSMNDWLPEGHLARFIIEIVGQLNLTAIKSAYAGRGSKAHHPEMLLALLFYGYATGVFSSRKLEQATYDSVAFRYIAANNHPDHDTIATFRKRFLPELAPLFVQILLIAQQMGCLKLGKVSLDGTKIKANASKHQALSWKYANELEAQLEAEVAELLRQAEEADSSEAPPDGLDLPAELARRKERLAAIARAKAEIERRAAERHAREQAEYEHKLAERKAKEQNTGRKRQGKEPKPPEPGPRDKDQVNLTDDESRIMPVPGGGFDQCYNAQAGVDVDSMLIVSQHLSQHPNDKLEIVPALAALTALPETLGTVDGVLADAGYFKPGQCRSLRTGSRSSLYQPETRCPQPAVARAYARARALARGCQRYGADEAPLANGGRPSPLRQAKMHGRTGVRHHQGRHGVPPVPVARGGVCPR